MCGSRTGRTLLVAIGAAAVAASALCAAAAPAPDPLLRLRKAMADGQTFQACIQARRLTERLAGDVAAERIDLLYKDYALKDKAYIDLRVFRELAIVAPEAWPVLRDEWTRLLKSTDARERKLKTRILLQCWEATHDTRALGLLAPVAIERKDWTIALMLQSIAGVGHGVTAMPTPAEEAAYWVNLAAWWKAHRPRWQGEMIQRREINARADKYTKDAP